MLIETPRTRLRAWRASDEPAFAALHADADVMRDLGGPIGRSASDAKLARYGAAFENHGFCRWAIERLDGTFLGYAGVMPSPDGHPLGAHFDVGWRLRRHAWGHGYATEAARATLIDIFDRIGLDEVLAYTSSDNFRSQAVMGRLGLQRDPARDFTATCGGTTWHGLVWVARRPPGRFSTCAPGSLTWPSSGVSSWRSIRYPRKRPAVRQASRRRRSNRPGTSQAKGPQVDGTLESSRLRGRLTEGVRRPG